MSIRFNPPILNHSFLKELGLYRLQLVQWQFTQTLKQQQFI